MGQDQVPVHSSGPGEKCTCKELADSYPDADSDIYGTGCDLPAVISLTHMPSRQPNKPEILHGRQAPLHVSTAACARQAPT
jgi:hypothetical protein